MPLLAPVVAPSHPPILQVPRPQPIHLRHTWTGWDGSLWDLCSDDSGVALNSGVRGLTMPPVNRYTTASPALPGSRWRGARTEERPVFWPLRIYTPELAEWYAYDAAFWRTMDPTQTGVWTVTNPVSQSVRTLPCRFVDDSDHAIGTDPALFGWMLYGINLVAEEPYWLGEPEMWGGGAEQSNPYYGGPTSQPGGVTGGGPPYWISRGNTLASASLSNPGDVEAYPVWMLDGPIDAGASVGVGDAITAYGPAIAEGKSIVFDMRPGKSGVYQIDTPVKGDGEGEDFWLAHAETAYLDGVNRYTSLSGKFARAMIPAGGEHPVSFVFTGGGWARVAIRPQFYRAW